MADHLELAPPAASTFVRPVFAESAAAMAPSHERTKGAAPQANVRHDVPEHMWGSPPELMLPSPEFTSSVRGSETPAALEQVSADALDELTSAHEEPTALLGVDAGKAHLIQVRSALGPELGARLGALRASVGPYLPPKVTAPYHWLKAFAGGQAPMVLETKTSRFLAANTGLRGGFGEFFLAIDQHGKLWGLKQMRSPEEIAQLRSRGQASPVHPTPFHAAQHEVNMTQRLAPGLDAQKLMYSDDNRTYIAMRCMTGSGARLIGLLKPEIRPRVARVLLSKAAEKFAFIHGHGFVHCDAKFDNTLVGFDGHLEVSDFGMTQLRPPVGKSSGTYVVPEMSVPHFCMTSKSDVFSLCVDFVHLHHTKYVLNPFMRALYRDDSGARDAMIKALMEYQRCERYNIPVSPAAQMMANYFAPLKYADRKLHDFILFQGLAISPKERASMQDVMQSDAAGANYKQKRLFTAYLRSVLTVPPRNQSASSALRDLYRDQRGR